MGGLLVEPSFVGGHEGPARLRRQVASAGGEHEIRLSEFAVVQRHQHGAVGEQRAEGLDQVQREGRPTRTLDVVDTLPGIEPHGRDGGGECAGEERVGERQAGVDRVGGRPSVAPLEGEGRQGGDGLSEEAGKRSEIEGGRLALQAEQHVARLGPCGSVGDQGETVEHGPPLAGLTAPVAAQQRAAVADLGGDQFAREGDPAGLVGREGVLRGAVGGAARPFAARGAEEPEAGGHPGDGHVAAQQFVHRRGRQRYRAGDHQVRHLVEGDGAVRLALDLDASV